MPPSDPQAPVPTYVINLLRQPDRRSRMSIALADQGLEPQFFDAVDAVAMEGLPSHEAHLTRGEVGCLLSHRNLLRRIATQESHPYALVLEDDVLFFEGFMAQLSEATEAAAQRSAGFVQLGWLPLTADPPILEHWRSRMAADRRIRRVVHKLHRSTPADPPLIQRRDPHWGTHCYLVSPSFAATIAGFVEGHLLGPYDHYLRALARLVPDRMWRTRFPIAGQLWGIPSSVDPTRSSGPPGYQLNPQGRVLRGPHPG